MVSGQCLRASARATLGRLPVHSRPLCGRQSFSVLREARCARPCRSNSEGFLRRSGLLQWNCRKRTVQGARACSARIPLTSALAQGLALAVALAGANRSRILRDPCANGPRAARKHFRMGWNSCGDCTVFSRPRTSRFARPATSVLCRPRVRSSHARPGRVPGAPRGSRGGPCPLHRRVHR